jgi:hypothetical protein
MPGHLLGVLEPSVILQVNRDASCPSGHCRSKRIYALEQGLPALEACDLNLLVQDLLEQVMHWQIRSCNLLNDQRIVQHPPHSEL